MAQARRFAAFISYSHKDEAFARWLHKSLETYQPPKGLLDSPKRTAPVFRDQEELAAAPDLTAELKEALDASDALVVICSPNAVRSPWVEQEIAYFRSIGKGDRIFPILAGGEPHAANPENEALPAPLRAGVEGQEALAADGRVPEKERRPALLKIIAGLLGLSLGQLVDRDAQRRRQRLVQMLAGAGVAATLAGVLTTAWVAEAQRSASETRARLLGEMRTAFELEDAPRAMTALAAVAPDLKGAERDAHAALLALWLAPTVALDEAIQGLAAGQTFRVGGRVFQRTADGVRALPFEPTTLAVDAGEGFLALDEAGRLWRWAPGAAPQDATPAGADFDGVVWQAGVGLKSGATLFLGARESASAGGATPILLTVGPDGKTHALVRDLEFGASMAVSADCAAASVQTETWPEDGGDPILSHQRVSFVTGAAEGGEAVSGAAIDLSGDHRRSLEQLVERCGGGVVHEADQRPTLTLPNLAEDRWTWTIGANETGVTEPIMRVFAAFADKIQRGLIDPVGEPLDLEEDPALEMAGSFGVFDQVGFPTAEAGAAAVFSGASGAQWGRTVVCADPLDGVGRARCRQFQFHGNFGDVRVTDRYVYAQNMAFSGQPMFRLIRRRDMAMVEMRAPEIQGLAGGRGLATVVSPSGATLLTAVGERLIRFDLTDEADAFALAYRDFHEAEALAGARDEFDMGVVDVSLAFLDENRIIAARDNGLVFAFDLESGRELWRFRGEGVRAADGARSEIAVAPDGRSVVVDWGGVGLALDAATGLPLTSLARLSPDYDNPLDVPEPEGPPPGPCPEAWRREGCWAANQLVEIAINGARTALVRVQALADGGFVYRSGGMQADLAPPPQTGAPALNGVACRTGFTVKDGRVVRFDPLAALAPGDTLSMADLVRACRQK